MKHLMFFVLFLLSPSLALASVTIDAQVIRNQSGSGSTFITSGFPVRPGDVTEAMVTGGLIKVYVNEGSGLAEKQCNITALRGRFADGSLRSILIQFNVDSMQQNNTANDYALPAQVVIDNGSRSSADLTYHRPTWTDVANNNVILATSSTYLVDTQVTFQKLTPTGSGSAVQQEQYDALQENRFDALVAADNEGSTNYERERALIAQFARTGDQKYQKQAVYKQTYLNLGLKYTTASSTYSYVTDITNPDGRPNDGATGVPSEPLSPRSWSYASMYLMTGYRDFWSHVAYLARINITGPNLSGISSQSIANSTIPVSGTYDTHRYTYFKTLAHLLPAYCIDATIKIQPPSTGTPADVNWENQLEWTLTALKTNEWNIRWLPFDSGSGTTPSNETTTVTQGGVSATIKGVYGVRMADPKRYPGKAMPSSGWLLITPPAGGSFTSGALTISGITANATGAEVSDYRNGLTGVMPWSSRLTNALGITGAISDGSGSVAGTILTVTNVPAGYALEIGANLFPASGANMTGGTFVVNQLTGTAGQTGTYTVSESQLRTSQVINAMTLLPVFQIEFTNNFLIDYYFNVKADSRIPAMVKANLDVILNNVNLMVPGDLHYGHTDSTYGNALYGNPYQLENPALHGGAAYELPEHARAIAFVLKTTGVDSTVNGASYSTWYDRLVDGANNPPSLLTWQWKNFGQFYGWGSDSVYMMEQTSLTGPSTVRTPTQWDAIPSDTPDLARTSGGSSNKWKIKSITTDE